MVYVGVDPGKAGGIVVLDERCRIHVATVMPVLKAKTGRAEFDLRRIHQLLYLEVHSIIGVEQPNPELVITVEKAPVEGDRKPQMHVVVNWTSLLE